MSKIDEIDQSLHPDVPVITETFADIYRNTKPKTKFPTQRAWDLFLMQIDPHYKKNWELRRIEFSDKSLHYFAKPNNATSRNKGTG